MELAVVVLAAGSGTRMKSKLPKVLHEVAGKPMLSYVVDEALALKPKTVITVVSPNYQAIKDCFRDKVEYVVQKEQLGTAHAVLQAAPKLKNFKGDILVLYGDTPLIQAASLQELISFHRKTGAVATITTAMVEDPTGYGRILRSESSVVKRIVEEKDAGADEKDIKEINTGMYCFQSDLLFENLQKVQAHNKQKEYYLPDVVGLFGAENKLIESFEFDVEEIIGINSRHELAQATLIMYQRTIGKWLDNQVTIVDPLNTYIEKDVLIGPDTIIYPQTFLKGNTKIGKACQIGPGSHVNDCEVEDESKVVLSVADNAKIGAGATIGPYSHLRPGAKIGEKSKVGAFAEVKNSIIGAGSKIPHLSYIGDTDIEESVNVGAGTITCNYDGSKKHKTVIKKGAFIGSDTMLVAPVTVGKNAFTGAGSVISQDVPDEALGLERSEQKNIENYAKKRRS